jgi:hypothetical protein
MTLTAAVLILAHKYPAGVAALSRYLAPAHFDIFVHVDAKVDIEPFRKTTHASPAVSFIDRINVFWRGWTMIEATMNLIQAAKRHRHYDSFVLLSDDSVPLVNRQVLLQALQTFPTMIQLRAHQQRRWRYDKFFMFDSFATQLRPTSVREVTDDTIERFERLITLKRRGKMPLDVFYEGSQWMALSNEAVGRVLQRWASDQWLRESFEFSDAPDESYIHTILGPLRLYKSRTLMKVDWSVRAPPRVYSSIAELEAVERREELFARKVDLKPDELNAWIDRMLVDSA